MALLRGEGALKVPGGPAQGLVHRVGGQGRALAVPVGIGFEIQGFLLSPEEGEAVQVVHALPRQLLRQPSGVGAQIILRQSGHVLRIEGVLIRGQGEEEVRPLLLTVLLDQGQVPGGGKDIPVRQGV